MKEEKKENGQYTMKVSQKAVIFDPEQNKFLLVKISDKFKGGNYYNAYGPWELAGGRIEEKEEINAALSREIKEEVGDIDFDVKGIIDCEKVSLSAGETMLLIYLVEYREGAIILSDEHSDYRWETAESIEKSKEYKPWLKEMVKKSVKYIESEKCLENWKRAQADFENFRKLQEKKMAEFREFANLDIIYQIIPVLDNFESSLEHIPEEKKDGGWVQGILYIKKQLEDVLRNNGIEEFAVKVGDKFDPEIHEAVADSNQRMKSESTNKINQVMQKGYKIGKRVIRAARVIVG
jgi:molecular chaperone GrpE